MKIFSGYHPCKLVKNYGSFRDGLNLMSHKTLMMGTEIVPEISAIFNQLTGLIVRENLINFSRRESLRSYGN